MLEFDINGFLNELDSIIKDDNNKKPVRITIKRYYTDVKGCKKKRKLKEANIKDSDEYYNLIRINHGKKKKSRLLLKNNKESTNFINELSKSLIKIDNSSKTKKNNSNKNNI